MKEAQKNRLTEELWEAQKALMHLIVPRRRAMDLWRTNTQVIFGGVEIAFEQYKHLDEVLIQERKGLKISGTLCQLSEDGLTLNHGGGLHFEGEHPTAIRGVLADLMPEDYRFVTMVMDYERSREFYDQANAERKAKLVNAALSYFRQYKVPPNCYFALLSNIPRGFRIEEFAKV